MRDSKRFTWSGDGHGVSGVWRMLLLALFGYLKARSSHCPVSLHPVPSSMQSCVCQLTYMPWSLTPIESLVLGGAGAPRGF